MIKTNFLMKNNNKYQESICKYNIPSILYCELPELTFGLTCLKLKRYRENIGAKKFLGDN